MSATSEADNRLEQQTAHRGAGCTSSARRLRVPRRGFHACCTCCPGAALELPGRPPRPAAGISRGSSANQIGWARVGGTSFWLVGVGLVPGPAGLRESQDLLGRQKPDSSRACEMLALRCRQAPQAARRRHGAQTDGKRRRTAHGQGLALYIHRHSRHDPVPFDAYAQGCADRASALIFRSGMSHPRVRGQKS